MTITIPDPMEWPLWLDIGLLVIAGYAIGLVVARMLLSYWGWTRGTIDNDEDGWLMAGLMITFAPLVPPIALVGVLLYAVLYRGLWCFLWWLVVPRDK